MDRSVWANDLHVNTHRQQAPHSSAQCKGPGGGRGAAAAAAARQGQNKESKAKQMKNKALAVGLGVFLCLASFALSQFCLFPSFVTSHGAALVVRGHQHDNRKTSPVLVQKGIMWEKGQGVVYIPFRQAYTDGTERREAEDKGNPGHQPKVPFLPPPLSPPPHAPPCRAQSLILQY